MNYFISAGEASGDLHAAELIAWLRRLDPDARFTFLGGDLMAAAAGSEPLIHYRDMAYMGFVDVVRHLGPVLGNMRRAKAAIDAARPDALIIVDYPSFNLRLADHAFKAGIPVYAYISPKVWAWKEGRIRKMRRLLRHVYSILPFEPDYFRRKNLPQVTYVGNPSREEIDARIGRLPSEDEFRRGHGLDGDRPILAVVPGSRVGEIRANLPVMAAVARRHPKFQAVIAGAPAVDPAIYAPYTDIPLVSGATFELMRFARAAMVTSGTATLECALLGTPQVACYRANGSRIAYEIFKRILKIPFVTLPNLITGREVIRELLVHQCTADALDAAVTPLLDPASPQSRKIADDYAELRRRLGTREAAATTARLIVDDLSASVNRNTNINKPTTK